MGEYSVAYTILTHLISKLLACVISLYNSAGKSTPLHYATKHYARKFNITNLRG